MRTSQTFPKVASIVGAVILAIVWLVPLLWALDTSLKPEPETTRSPITWLPNAPTLAAYQSVIDQGDLIRWFLNSSVVSVLVTGLTLVVSVLAAFGFSRTRFPGCGGATAQVVITP